MRDPEQRRDEGVSPGLLGHALACVDEDHSEAARRGAGDHRHPKLVSRSPAEHRSQDPGGLPVAAGRPEAADERARRTCRSQASQVGMY